MCSRVFRVRFNRGHGWEKFDLGGIETGRLPTDRTLSFRPNPDPFLMKDDLQQNVDSTPLGTISSRQ